ncbi:MAG: cysteine desulfurase family protein [Parvibaculum sp.]|nr:cysteine desulfurase family protein [Parvibaculum sp.]
MTTKRIYLDHNATAPVRPEAAAAVAHALTLTGNPSSVHGEGRRALALIEGARAEVASLVGAKTNEVIFTSGGTEAANLALHLAKTSLGIERLIISAIEHDCIRAPALASGLPLDILPVDANGVADLAALEALLAKPGKALVALMHANNETGVIQPVSEAATLAHAAGALLLADTIQTAGRLSVDMKALGADMILLSAHKLGGPQGVGALVIRASLPFESFIKGGGQEKRRRAGTENLSGIAGFGVAARLVRDENMSADLRDYMEAELRRAVPDISIFGAHAPRLANTSLFAASGLASETLIVALDLDRLAVSAGSACSSGKVARSHVLSAMGVSDDLAGAAIRVSLGRETTKEDIDHLVTSWTRYVKRASDKVKNTNTGASSPALAEVEH